MKKMIIALVLSTIMLASTVPVLAQSTPTEAEVLDNGGGAAPIIKAKWETPDEDLTKPWTQITPPLSYKGTKPITYWVIVTDTDGWDNIDAAYVDVYHPENETCEEESSSFKYQVELEEVGICDVNGNFNENKYNQVVKALTDADTYGSVQYGDSYDLDEVAHELLKCSAKAYKGTEVIDYHQMCGEFQWEYQCVGTPPNCEYEWKPSCMDGGYRVEAYAFDKNGLRSATLTNYFEYICMSQVEVDFTKLDFENVLYKTHKWIEGDDTFDSPGPACKLGQDCVAPTIRNLGNMPVNIQVMQDDMDFGYSGLESDPDWNVQWDARLAEYGISIFEPYEPTTLDGVLGLCNTREISFSIYVEKPPVFGTHTGEVEIEPIPIVPHCTCSVCAEEDICDSNEDCESGYVCENYCCVLAAD